MASENAGAICRIGHNLHKSEGSVVSAKGFDDSKRIRLSRCYHPCGLPLVLWTQDVETEMWNPSLRVAAVLWSIMHHA